MSMHADPITPDTFADFRDQTIESLARMGISTQGIEDIDGFCLQILGEQFCTCPIRKHTVTADH